MQTQSHAWGENRILTFLKEGRRLHDSIIKGEAGSFPPPRFISCWISEVCNLDCTYCYFSETNYDKSHRYIDTHKFLNWLGDAKSFGAESLEFSGGGEPTLHPDFQMIYEHAANMIGYKIGIITHACNDMPIESMTKHFRYVRCGLDSATAETHDLIKRNKRKDYWFHKAIENIKEMVRLRDQNQLTAFTVGIKVVVNQINFHEIRQMSDLAVSLGVNYIQIKHEHSSDHPLSDEQLQELHYFLLVESERNKNRFTQVTGTAYHQKATVKCFMSPIHTVVTATGKILQCCFFEKRPIGTIDQRIMDVWGGEEHRKVIEMTTVNECDKVDCRWHYYNRRISEVIEDPLAQASFI